MVNTISLGRKGERRFQLSLPVLLVLLGLAMVAVQVFADPAGPTITYIANESGAGVGSGTAVGAGDVGPGGNIITMNLISSQQNTHWKGFVGNISGAFALSDSAGYYLYEWSVGSFTGEVYASRISGVTWTTVNCSNITHVNITETFHDMTTANTPYDSLSFTFNESNWHPAFSIGDIAFAEDICNYTTKTRNGTGWDKDNNTESQFEEVMLWDSTGNVPVFMTMIESDAVGFDNSTYDYQMILPENSTAGAAASNTVYYFFVELL